MARPPERAQKISGFTLIELMIVVAIIGVLASIAIPKFGNAITRSKEAAVQGQLGAVRSGINIYYADNEGTFPSHLGLALTTNSKYMTVLPTITIPPVAIQGNPGHPANNVDDLSGVCPWVPGDNGTTIWYYNPLGTCNGQVMIHCIHADSKGNEWTSY